VQENIPYYEPDNVDYFFKKRKAFIRKKFWTVYKIKSIVSLSRVIFSLFLLPVLQKCLQKFIKINFSRVGNEVALAKRVSAICVYEDKIYVGIEVRV
jgi:hypothetical protein